MGLIDLINEGGMIMLPLLVCSILVFAISIERFWFYYQCKIQFKQLVLTSRELVSAKKFNEAKGLSHSILGCIGGPYLHIFENISDWDQVMQRRLSETQLELKKYLWILGTVGSSAPFIGLFGTVVGIIKSFESMATTGKAGFSVVAAGLSEALIATAAGIFVAVIAIIFYNTLLTKVKYLQTSLKNDLEDLRDFVRDHGQSI